MALFGEKYGDRVRVVTIPGFSVELCGGTHARATGDIGLFTIAQEGGVASGVRRIEALTGDGALHDYQTRRETLHKLVTALGVSDGQAADAASRLQQETRRLVREVQDLKVKLAMAAARRRRRADTGEVDSAECRSSIGAGTRSGRPATTLGPLEDKQAGVVSSHRWTTTASPWCRP